MSAQGEKQEDKKGVKVTLFYTVDSIE
jgi:hypothetical protein